MRYKWDVKLKRVPQCCGLLLREEGKVEECDQINQLLMACETPIKKSDNYHMEEGQQSWQILVPLLKDLNYITQHVELHKLSRRERIAVTSTLNQLSSNYESERLVLGHPQGKAASYNSCSV